MVDWLGHWRRTEDARRSTALQLTRSDALLRVALAWSLLPVSFDPPADTAAAQLPDSEPEIWLWLWDFCDADERELAAAAGVLPEDCRLYLKQLIASRLIYPDGTVAAVVTDTAERQMADTLPRGL